MKTGFVFALIILFSLPLKAEDDALRKVASELAEGIHQKEKAKVAVLAFPHHDDRDSDGPFMVSEQVATVLSKDKKISLVERNHIVDLLDQLHLSETGVLDSETANKIGQALGADIIVTGTLINLPQNKCEVNARAMLSKNGRIIAASRTVIDRKWDSPMSLDFKDASRGTAGNGLKMISKKLAQGLKVNKPPLTVGLLNFPYSRSRLCTGSYLISERLLTYLVQDGAILIERRLLKKILEERKLWETGIIDTATLQKVGPFLGVDAVITGTLSDLSDTATEVFARAVRVDTGEIIAAASAVIERIWNDPPRLPLIAQPRSAVPIAMPPMKPVQESDITVATGHLMYKQLRMGPGRTHVSHKRYYPAPVPFIMSVSPMQNKGENHQ